jgi:hypothetical protein
VASQAPDLAKRENSLIPFDCPRDNLAVLFVLVRLPVAVGWVRLPSRAPAKSRDELIERYFGVDVLWRSRVYCDMLRCFSFGMDRRALPASARKVANRETRNLHKNFTLRPLPVGVLLKETNC